MRQSHRPCGGRSERSASSSHTWSRQGSSSVPTARHGGTPCAQSTCRRARSARTTSCGPHEDRALLNAACPHHHRIVVWLLRYTGVRVAEARALTVADIDLTPEGEALTVRGSKTRAATRTVPIPPQLLPLIHEHLESLRQAGRRGRTATIEGVPERAQARIAPRSALTRSGERSAATSLTAGCDWKQSASSWATVSRVMHTHRAPGRPRARRGASGSRRGRHDQTRSSPPRGWETVVTRLSARPDATLTSGWRPVSKKGLRSRQVSGELGVSSP